MFYKKNITTNYFSAVPSCCESQPCLSSISLFWQLNLKKSHKMLPFCRGPLVSQYIHCVRIFPSLKQNNFFLNYSKPCRQTVEKMYLHRSGSFISVVCSGITVLWCSVVVHSAVLSCTCWCSWHLRRHKNKNRNIKTKNPEISRF